MFRNGLGLILVFAVLLFVWISVETACASDETPPMVQGPALTKESQEAAKSDADPVPDKAPPADEETPCKEPADKADATKEPTDQSADEEKPKDESEKTEREPSEPDDSLPAQEEKTTGKKSFSVGEPLAPGMMKLLDDEIVEGIKRRGIIDRFARFQRYMIGKVEASAPRYTGSELSGNCRLSWYDHLMRNALSAPVEAERFTRLLHIDALDDCRGIAKLLATAAEKLDLGKREPRDTLEVETPEQAFGAVRQALIDAQTAYCAALAPLGKSEIRELLANAVRSLSTQNRLGHTLADRGTGRRMCDLMEKMDREAMVRAAEALAPLADVKFLEQLKSLSCKRQRSGVPGAAGEAMRIETSAGAIVISGKGNNTYELDKMMDVAAVIDLGGDDVYLEGTVGPLRPVLLLIDLAGNDVYRASNPGVQGGSVLGVSMLLDLEGNDTYQAQEVAQGSTIAGVGILVDFAGDDRYAGLRRLQGQALGGVGLLIDRAGNDSYRAALWAQGMGAPLGFAMLDDLDGDDHYFCGGQWPDSYEETPGREGWGQGVGAGLRQVANGGVGVILDGGGDDVYEFDYLAHGGGYWCGLGFARDFGGNDQRLVTRTAFNGGPRTEPNFQRFGCGWGCHYAMGFLFDDAGDDVYEGRIMGTGMAWDCSLGALCDFAGNDVYKAAGGLTQGVGAQMGFGILFDYNGDDVFHGSNQGYAPPSISYHTLPGCGGNFSFLVDYGGSDSYGSGARNSSYIQRGDAGGYVIDRPRQDETESTANHSQNEHTTGS